MLPDEVEMIEKTERDENGETVDLKVGETTKRLSSESLRRLSAAAVHTIVDKVKAMGDPAREEFKWIRVLATGILVGCVEYFPTLFITIILEWRHSLLQDSLTFGGPWHMCGVYVAWAICCTLLAVIPVVFIAPAAGGSGLPFIIGYLKSGHIDTTQFTLATLGVKLTGTIFGICSGLAIGREGPAIHIGAIAGFLVYRMFDVIFKKYKFLPEDSFSGTEVHNTTIMGCAAGFASAFRAPLAGMLYALEELATHWGIKEHKEMGGRTFLCTALAALMIQFLIDVASDSGSGKGINFSSVIIFGEDADGTNGFKYIDLPYFLLIAVWAGISAGFQCKFSLWVFQARKKMEWCRTKWGKVLDVTLLAALTAFVYAAVPIAMGGCQTLEDDRRLAGAKGSRMYWDFQCDGKYEYNELASMTLSGSESVIQHMFSRDDEDFGVGPILSMYVFYFPLAVLVIGTAVPAGTFVPALMMGALVGRAMGVLVHTIHGDFASDPGVYAVVGSAAFLGGWTRTMLAIVVVVCEITGDVSLTIPMIICVKLARIVAGFIEPEGFTHALMEYVGMHDMKAVPPENWLDPKLVEEILEGEEEEEQEEEGEFNEMEDNEEGDGVDEEVSHD